MSPANAQEPVDLMRATSLLLDARHDTAAGELAREQLTPVFGEMIAEVGLLRDTVTAYREDMADMRAELAEYEAVRAAVTKGGHLDRPLTVSDVLVAHDVTRKALADALGVGWHLNWAQLVEEVGRRRAFVGQLDRQLGEARDLTAAVESDLGEARRAAIVFAASLKDAGHNDSDLDEILYAAAPRMFVSLPDWLACLPEADDA